MRNTVLILISVLIVPTLLADKGKNYAKENVCQELKAIGIEKFKEMVTVLYSQKFPNGTFQEVSCVADEMSKLAEKCCKDDASPDCYDKGATEISEKSCGKNSPFPKHPGIEQCCTLQGQERKLCLASLRYTADELASLTEPTNEEICTEYTKDEKDFTVRYVYEFARRHRNIPAGFVLNATQNHVRMAERCCRPAVKITCFLHEKLQLRSSNIFLRFLSNVCNNQVNLKSFKFGLSAYYGNLLGLSFEEASALSSCFHSGLEKCCLKPQPECMIEELTSFQKVLCGESKLDSLSEDFQKCCKKPALDTLLCVDDLKRQPRQFPDVASPVSSKLCEEAQPHGIDRYLFLTGVNHAFISLPVLTTILDRIKNTVTACCSSDKITMCLTEQESKLKKTQALLSKLDDTCSRYFKLDLPVFKTLIQKEVQGEGGEKRTQAWLDLAMSCCSQRSPAQLCQKLTEDVIKYDDSTV
ncbi:vitamin D-binding protein-like isoform X1 [Carassius carassius]|uniref:vitamin D-binding protein-like isoform X1 n=1 Tax=Carassius carassius TaxID=217509 RepID=UPI0028698022|nr:vitamin D-binding protein-like isoform X1 [Carassius carassius]